MSAFIVSEKHLQTLINWAMVQDVYFYFNGHRYEATHTEEAELLLTVLYRQNVRSVDERYSEKNTIESLKVKPMGAGKIGKVSPVQILKACDCYDYQACETDDYRQTFAADIINRIRSHAIGMLPGYDDAKWEIV